MLESGEDFLCTTHPSQIARYEGNLQLVWSPHRYAGSVVYGFPSVASIIVNRHARNLLNTDSVWCSTQLLTPIPNYIFTTVEGKCTHGQQGLIQPCSSSSHRAS